MLLPFFSGAGALVPRVLLSGLFAAALIEGSAEHDTLRLTGLVAELLFGLVIALPAIIVCEAAEGLAELFDAGRGQTLATQYGAYGDSSVAVTGFAVRFVCWTLLVSAGLLERLLALTQMSLSAIPPGTASLVVLAEQHSHILKTVLLVVTYGFVSYLPFATLFLAVDFIAAACQMILPAAHLHVEAFIVKSFVGGIVVYVFLNSGGAETLPGLLLSFFEVTGTWFAR